MRVAQYVVLFTVLALSDAWYLPGNKPDHPTSTLCLETHRPRFTGVAPRDYQTGEELELKVGHTH